MSALDVRALRREKAALTRAENSGDPQKIIDVCERALERFDHIGWPDDWSRWERAKQDAELKVAYS